MHRWQGLVDALSDAEGALWFGERAVDRAALLEWLLGRQIRSGRNAGLFEPSAADYETRRLVTGERMKTKLATIHVMSQEAARTLHLVAAGEPTAAEAVRRAAERLGATCYGGATHCTIGECATSFAGYLRFLHAVDGDAAMPEVAWRIQTLSAHRDGRGRWTRFPFRYTSLVLLEIDSAEARDELAYARAALGRRVPSLGEPFASRGRMIEARVLALRTNARP